LHNEEEIEYRVSMKEESETLSPYFDTHSEYKIIWSGGSEIDERIWLQSSLTKGREVAMIGFFTYLSQNMH